MYVLAQTRSLIEVMCLILAVFTTNRNKFDFIPDAKRLVNSQGKREGQFTLLIDALFDMCLCSNCLSDVGWPLVLTVSSFNFIILLSLHEYILYFYIVFMCVKELFGLVFMFVN